MNNPEALMDHDQYQLPYGHLSLEQIELLRQIRAGELKQLYDYWCSLYHNCPNSTGGIQQLHKLQLNSAPCFVHLNDLRIQWDALSKRDKTSKSNEHQKRHLPGFLTAVIWTRLRQWCRRASQPCFVCAGDQCMIVPCDEVQIFAFYLNALFGQNKLGNLKTNDWHKVLLEFPQRNSTDKTHGFKWQYLQWDMWTALNKLRPLMPCDDQRKSIERALDRSDADEDPESDWVAKDTGTWQRPMPIEPGKDPNVKHGENCWWDRVNGMWIEEF
jgi:hypothetical protein